MKLFFTFVLNCNWILYKYFVMTTHVHPTTFSFSSIFDKLDTINDNHSLSTVLSLYCLDNKITSPVDVKTTSKCTIINWPRTKTHTLYVFMCITIFRSSS